MNASEGWLKPIAQAEERFNEIAAADNLVQFKREAMFAHQAIQASSYLQKCTPPSIFNAIINVASVGITLSPAEKLAYLVPRYSKDQKATLCCLDISYRGMKDIAESSGGIKTAVAELVYSEDTFKWVDKFTKPVHEYDPFAPLEHRGDCVGGYCMAILSSGVIQVEPMSIEEITKIQDSSEAKNGPWKTWWGEMAKKTLVRRASKMWPHSPRMQEANHVLDQHQGLVDVDHRLEATAPVPQPTPAAEEPQKGEPKKEPPTPEKKNTGPMLPGQVKILKARAKSADVDEARIWKKFGPLEALTFSDFETIQKWIADGAPE